MSAIKWYYPPHLNSALDLLHPSGNIVHAGGTGILLSGFSGVKGIIDLGKLNLNHCSCDNQTIRIGAMSSFAQIIEYLQSINPTSILIKSLSQAGTTPLRNRITLGGSLAFLPLWSDLIGPLIALRAKVILTGINHGIYDIEEFIRKRSLLEKSLITEITYPLSDKNNYYYRSTITKVGFSNFTLTITGNQEGPVIKDIGIVFTGTKNKYQRLTSTEEKLNNQRVATLNLEQIVNSIQVEFSTKEIGSPRYLYHLAKYHLLSGLQKVFYIKTGS